jgi:outer membrane protein
MRPNLITSLVLLTLSAPLQAADLLDYYREAQVQDAAYASAKAAYEVAKEKIPQAESANNIQAKLAGSVARVNQRNPRVDLFTNAELGTRIDNFNAYGYTLTLGKSLYNTQNNLQIDQAKLSVSQVEAQYKLAEMDLAQRVAQAYFDVLLAQDNVALSGAQKKAISEQLAQAKRNFEVGTATIVDSQDAQARFDLSSAKEIADINDLEVKRQAFVLLTGKAPQQLALLKENIQLPLPQPNNMDEWVGTAEKQNLQIAIQRTAVDIARKQIDTAKAAYGPTVDLFGSYGDNGTGNNLSDGRGVKDARVGVQLAVPLYSGGLTQSRVREALLTEQKLKFDLENTRRLVGQSARQAFLGVTSGVAQVKALEQSLSSTELALKSTMLGREVGVRTSVDVLNAQQQVFQTRRDLFSARYNVILNELRLKQASGVLTEADLAEVNKNLAVK